MLFFFTKSIGSFLVGAHRYLKGLVLRSLVCGLMQYDFLICYALSSIMVTTVLFNTVNTFIAYSVSAHVISSEFGLLIRISIHFHIIVVFRIETARWRLILEGLHLVILLIVDHSSGAC